MSKNWDFLRWVVLVKIYGKVGGDDNWAVFSDEG